MKLRFDGQLIGSWLAVDWQKSGSLGDFFIIIMCYIGNMKNL